MAACLHCAALVAGDPDARAAPAGRGDGLGVDVRGYDCGETTAPRLVCSAACKRYVETELKVNGIRGLADGAMTFLERTLSAARQTLKACNGDFVRLLGLPSLAPDAIYLGRLPLGLVHVALELRLRHSTPFRSAESVLQLVEEFAETVRYAPARPACSRARLLLRALMVQRVPACTRSGHPRAITTRRCA